MERIEPELNEPVGNGHNMSAGTAQQFSIHQVIALTGHIFGGTAYTTHGKTNSSQI